MKRNLLHILPDLTINGCYNLACLLIKVLDPDYNSFVMVQCDDLNNINYNAISFLREIGAKIYPTEKIEASEVQKTNCDIAILYNITNNNNIGTVLPSIYYSYGVYDPNINETVTLVCSNFAKTYSRFGYYDNNCINKLKNATVFPAIIDTRPLRYIKQNDQYGFTIGLLTSGSDNKYPCDMYINLLAKLPDNATILITTLPQYKHPGMLTALHDFAAREPNRIKQAIVHPGAGIKYLSYCNVLIYATANDFYEPYGRFVMEALALGKPVICENKAVFKETLEHKYNVLFYNNIEEIVEYIKLIQKDILFVRQLSANAQLYASWHDTAANAGILKNILKEL